MRASFLAFVPTLLVSAAAMAQPQASTSLGDPDRQVCRREAVVGSLVPMTKLCLTPAEWAKRNAELDDPRRAQELRPF